MSDSQIDRLSLLVDVMRKKGIAYVKLGPEGIHPSMEVTVGPEPHDPSKHDTEAPKAETREQIRARIKETLETMYAASGSRIPDADLERLVDIEMQQRSL